MGDSGLTMEGVALVKEMDRLGMVHDISHLSRTSVDDLLGTARGPVIASHVAADAVFAHRRNLTDDHLRAVAQRGGVVGLVLYAGFLGEGRASFDDAMRHLLHMIEICGVEAVGIGSDMDGGFGKDKLARRLPHGGGSPPLRRCALRQGFFGRRRRQSLRGELPKSPYCRHVAAAHSSERDFGDDGDRQT